MTNLKDQFAPDDYHRHWQGDGCEVYACTHIRIDRLYDAYSYFYVNPQGLPYTAFPAGWSVTRDTRR